MNGHYIYKWKVKQGKTKTKQNSYTHVSYVA